MFGTIFLVAHGALHVFYAFREPPEAIAHFFTIPVAFALFPEEKRAMYGRIAVGTFLIALGIMCVFDLPLLSVGGPLVGFVLLGLQIAGRWKVAGEDADAMEAERKAAMQSFEQLKGDARFHHLHRAMSTKYRMVFGKPQDAVAYEVQYIGLMDDRGGSLFTPDLPRARFLVAYLKRKTSPARIQATLDLQSGACSDVAMGWMAYDSMIPVMY